MRLLLEPWVLEKVLVLGAKDRRVPPEPCLPAAGAVWWSRDASECGPRPRRAAGSSGPKRKERNFLCWRCARLLTRLVTWRLGRDWAGESSGGVKRIQTSRQAAGEAAERDYLLQEPVV